MMLLCCVSSVWLDSSNLHMSPLFDPGDCPVGTGSMDSYRLLIALCPWGAGSELLGRSGESKRGRATEVSVPSAPSLF